MQFRDTYTKRLKNYASWISNSSHCSSTIHSWHLGSIRYIDDVFSINNPEFENYLGQMYPVELEIKDTTEINTSASYLYLLLSIRSDSKLHTSIYDKRDDINFYITNFPFLSSNIPPSPAFEIFISQLIRYARVCSSYECFILRATRLPNKLLE